MHYPIERSVVVYTPKSLQIERLMKRDNISEEEALLKISNQMDIEKKKELATFIIDNSSSLKNLQNEVENLKEKLL
jgi:dephospho-CoA kinase